jgi:hypothetical protein
MTDTAVTGGSAGVPLRDLRIRRPTALTMGDK